MQRVLIVVALFSFLVCAQGQDKQKSKVKPLPDRYKQFKLGMPRKLLERKITPVYTHEASADIRIMVCDVGGNEIQGLLFVFWKEKLASIIMVFQPGYTLKRIKAGLVRKYGEPTKEDPMETLWVDSERVMGLKFEYNIMDLRDRVTLSYSDISAYQEIKAATGKVPPGAGKRKRRRKGGVPPP
ncbi:MAG: hypothetical protein GXP25_22080 [Planctomycetes bacterium]|nr:hypothetical protein [Planctomycetota bacterium]